MISGPEKDNLWDTVNNVFFEERLFPDLIAVFIWLFFSILFIYVPFLNETPVRVLLSLPIILFIPGYILIAALFPQKNELDLIERIALSFGLSIAVVPLIGLGLNYTPWGIRLDPIVTSLSIFIFIMGVIAQYRRGILPKNEQYEFPLNTIITGLKEDFFSPEQTRTDQILSIILLISIITTVFVTIFVIAVPKDGERFTEFYILGEKQMAADYPSKIFTGQDYPMYIGIGNHEYQNISYTLETYLVNMKFNPDDASSSVIKMDPLDTIVVTVPHNETMTIPYTLNATDTDYNRIEFLLFNETLPANYITKMDRINASYRDLHLWVTVYPPEMR